MRATWNGTVIAESDKTLVVEGNHYFPPDSVRWDLLAPSPTRTTCSWKGEARYWSVTSAGSAGVDVGWEYAQPSAAAQEIAGRLAFWRGVRVTA